MQKLRKTKFFTTAGGGVVHLVYLSAVISIVLS